jgi:hypothetical protein
MQSFSEMFYSYESPPYERLGVVLRTVFLESCEENAPQLVS